MGKAKFHIDAFVMLVGFLICQKGAITDIY